MILSMKVLLLGAAMTTATATATAQGTTGTTATERTVHAGEYVKTITVGTTATEITSEGQTVKAAKGAKVKVTAAPPQQGKRARLVITKAASSTSGQTQSGTVDKVIVKSEGEKATVNVNETLQMVATVTGTGDFDNTVTWSLYNLDASGENITGTRSYALITSDGLLIGYAAGKVRVFATSNHDNSTQGYCDIEVKEPDPQPQTGENGGGQGTGEVTPGGQGGGQASSKIGTEHDHYLKINFPDGKEIFHSGESISLSVSDRYVIDIVIWSVNKEPYVLNPSADSHSCEFTSGHLGTVRVTATLKEDPDVTAYQDFQVVE